MCGIVGAIAFGGGTPPTRGQISGMCDTIVHRGPDAEGIHVDGPIGLGARRLAIIDLVGGDQPLRNEDGSVVMVFNGEIYNYRELRRTLVGRGHAFRSQTDGEVLVHLWEEHGSDFLTSVNGMFALALFDAGVGTLVLARDRIGIKPLFWARTAEHLVFGSEPKALLASGLVDRTLDLDALHQFLAWEYVPAPATLFRSMRKLRPGEMLEAEVGSGSVRARPYWDVPLEGASSGHGRRLGDAEWEEALATKLGESVRRQLVSDVPLGAFLSGGVDSSAVVAEMGPVSTFSIGFDDPSYNELRWSKRVAAHLGVPHETEIIDPDVRGLFERLMPFLDDPIADFSIFPTYLVSRLARRDVTVALSGDGGDELFAGYDTYVAEALAARHRRLLRVAERLLGPIARRVRPRAEKKGVVNKAKRMLEGLAYPEELRHARWRLFLDPGRAVFTAEAAEQMAVPPDAHVRELFARARDLPPLDQLLYVDLKSYLAENCLTKVDRMSMACSLEARVPILDHELVELAFRMPGHLKLSGGETKVALKRVAARKIPRECVYRRKEGFSVPIKNWLRGPLEPMMRDLLSSDRLRSDGIFAVDAVEALVAEHVSGRHNHSHLLWALMVFHDWKRRWIE